MFYGRTKHRRETHPLSVYATRILRVCQVGTFVSTVHPSCISCTNSSFSCTGITHRVQGLTLFHTFET
ncbi:hypothetical protein COCSADRAFT_206023 [Bipolaris sorokiniana ND90Pr]|uniref:Uncharacterized protein n=1 Tax=Cochliobolus sativus (strain ND90Pr / ATCC 201652) TaxID=665912 RepID=M2T3S2_COCSN|nr:uncharacterized protein COCSADRAFT_206023 [Bipolaris sorokiniana ND90Pr]EMD69070.1 hypothetical protein COCSADRAFT_206023 [Bipolaris sorokiniana ND90Pr]